jgi:hypothetical protein
MGSIEKIRRMFDHFGMTTDSEGTDQEHTASYDEAVEQELESQINGDSPAANITRNSLPLKPSTTPDISASLHDAESKADYHAMLELSTLPKDVLRFAHWAFGHNGVPSLQVLAYGDFSFRGRYASKTYILCWQALKASKSKDEL